MLSSNETSYWMRMGTLSFMNFMDDTGCLCFSGQTVRYVGEGIFRDNETDLPLSFDDVLSMIYNEDRGYAIIIGRLYDLTERGELDIELAFLNAQQLISAVNHMATGGEIILS